MDDIDRILRVASRYGIKVYLTPSFPRSKSGCDHDENQDPRGFKMMEPSSKSTSGPIWHYCNPDLRTVWFDNLDPFEVETNLHEICHVIMNPPGGIEELSEDVALMPFERTLARQILSDTGYRKVIEWQEMTQIEWYDSKVDKYYGCLADVPNYERMFYWRQSFENLRRMGVIENGRVTWKYPNWRRATKDLMARGNLE